MLLALLMLVGGLLGGCKPVAFAALAAFDIPGSDGGGCACWECECADPASEAGVAAREDGCMPRSPLLRVGLEMPSPGMALVLLASADDERIGGVAPMGGPPLVLWPPKLFGVLVPLGTRLPPPPIGGPARGGGGVAFPDPAPGVEALAPAFLLTHFFVSGS